MFPEPIVETSQLVGRHPEPELAPPPHDVGRGHRPFVGDEVADLALVKPGAEIGRGR